MYHAQLTRALGTDGKGHRFTCRLGVRNYWFPIRVRGETLGIAYLQALDHSNARPPAGKRSARTGPHRPRRAGAKMLSRLKFDRAARFLQHIVQHVQTASLSDLRKADLTSAGPAVLALESEQARLHDALQRHLPPTPEAPRRSGPESHAEQIVHCLLECVAQRYAQPIMLRQCAVELGVNAAYASSLFSRAVGIPFKTYLTERRLEKAKELLSDPAKTASEVAQAVGYGSEDRFRIAFKKATGLSPKLWRETMQTNRPKPSPSTILWRKSARGLVFCARRRQTAGGVRGPAPEGPNVYSLAAAQLPQPQRGAMFGLAWPPIAPRWAWGESRIWRDL